MDAFTTTLLCLVVFMCALIAVLLFAEKIPALETKIVTSISTMTSKPRWFVFWLLIFLLWVPIRVLMMKVTRWYTPDVDMVVMTFLWSVMPFMVENVLKSSSAMQMELLLKMLDMISKSQVRSEEQERLIIALAQRIFDAIEEDESAHDGGEPSQHG